MSQVASATPPGEGGDMSLMGHLQELRVRLMWVVGSIILFTLAAMFFATPILEFLTEPLVRYGDRPQAIGPTDTIVVFFKVSLTTGAAFAMPMIAYHLIAFVSPGLFPHEKRALLIILPGFLLLFLIGAAFAFFVMLPAAVGFLQSFLAEAIRQDWTIDRFISFVTRIVFWIGVSFEMPLVVAFLARIGVVSGPLLKKYWRHSIVVNAIVAAMITPTVDPVNMAIVMGPLIILYFFSMGLAYLLYRPREPRDFSD
jgi:sec-independent protein translocase protein TatC